MDSDTPSASFKSFATHEFGVEIPIELRIPLDSGSRSGLFRLRALFTISRAFSIIFCNSGLDT